MSPVLSSVECCLPLEILKQNNQFTVSVSWLLPLKGCGELKWRFLDILDCNWWISDWWFVWVDGLCHLWCLWMIASTCLITKGRRFESVEAAPQVKWHLLILHLTRNLSQWVWSFSMPTELWISCKIVNPKALSIFREPQQGKSTLMKAKNLKIQSYSM